MPNKIPHEREAEIVWKSSGGDAVLTLTSLGAAAGRQGASHDLFGALGAKAVLYEWRLATKFATTPVVGEVIEVYLKTWDEDQGRADNDDGTADAAVSAEDKLRNLQMVGVVTVDEAATAVEMASSGRVLITSRYVAPVIWNRTADGLSATAGDHEFSLTPVIPEIQ